MVGGVLLDPGVFLQVRQVGQRAVRQLVHAAPVCQRGAATGPQPPLPYQRFPTATAVRVVQRRHLALLLLQRRPLRFPAPSVGAGGPGPVLRTRHAVRAFPHVRLPPQPALRLAGPPFLGRSPLQAVEGRHAAVHGRRHPAPPAAAPLPMRPLPAVRVAGVVVAGGAAGSVVIVVAALSALLPLGVGGVQPLASGARLLVRLPAGRVVVRRGVLVRQAVREVVRGQGLVAHGSLEAGGPFPDRLGSRTLRFGPRARRSHR